MTPAWHREFRALFHGISPRCKIAMPHIIAGPNGWSTYLDVMQRARFICARPGRCTAFLPCARGTRRANILTSSSMKRVAWEEKRARGAAPISIAGSERPVVRRGNLTIRRGDRVKAVIQLFNAREKLRVSARIHSFHRNHLCRSGATCARASEQL
jgi:hypothetical protein